MVNRDQIRVPASLIWSLLAASMVAAVGCGGPPRPPERPTFERVAVNQRGVGIPYGAVVLFRVEKELIAFRVVDAPKWGYSIEYEWNAAPAAEDTFETASTGAGETDEQRRRSTVTAGPLYMRWSRGSPDFGWLYWPEDEETVSVASIAFRSVDSIDLQDPDIFWYTQEMFE